MIHKRKPVRISHQRAVMLSPNWLESFSARRVTCTKKTFIANMLQCTIENRPQSAFAFGLHCSVWFVVFAVWISTHSVLLSLTHFCKHGCLLC